MAEAPAFSLFLSPPPPQAYYFSIIAIFTVMPSESLSGGERVYVQKYWVEPP